MTRIFALMMVILFSSLAYGQSPPGLSKDEVIAAAREQALLSNPPMNASRIQTANAVYVPGENAWIVDFVDESSTVSDSDYMLRVQVTSGKAPELLRGSQKQRYKSLFKGAAND